MLQRLPQPENLRSVSELDGRLMAVGDFGTLVVREAGESRWELRRLPTTRILRDILQLDANTVLVAGQGGLWLSRDGGENWSQIRSGDSFRVLARQGTRVLAVGSVALFSDDLVNWEEAENSPRAGTRDIVFPKPAEAYVGLGLSGVFRTADGGKNWFPWDPATNLGVFEAMAAPTPEVGLLSAGGGQLYRTLDWLDFSLVASLPRPAVSIHFPRPELGYLITDGGEVYRSEDQGKTWQARGTLANGVFSLDIVGHGASGLTIVGRNGLIVDGSNAGAVLVEHSSGLNHDFLGVVFARPDLAFGIASYRGLPAELLRSPDGGLGWSPAASPANPPVDLDFLGPGLGLLVGRDGQVFVSRDAGDSWSDAGAPGLGGRTLDAGFLLDEQTWLVGGQDGLVLRTGDAGASWQEVGIPGLSTPVEDFDAFPGTGIILARSRDGIHRSADRGLSWEQIGELQSLKDLHCVDGSTVVAVGQGIHRSTDRGQSWELVSTAPSLLAVHFLGPQQGLAVGAVGATWETRDAGASWEQHELSSIWLFDVEGDGAGGMLAVGEQGLVIAARRPAL